MNKIESGIIDVLKQGVPLQLAKIAKTLSVTRWEINHYLYSSLNGSIVKDSQYRWMLKLVIQTAGEQLSLFENKPARSQSAAIKESLPLHKYAG